MTRVDAEPGTKKAHRQVEPGKSRAITDLPDDLLSIPAASARLGISANTGCELARRGQFPGAVRIGAKWRVSVIKLERYLHGPEVPS